MLILVTVAHFWPVFDLLQPQHLCQTFQLRIFIIVLTGLSEIGMRIPINYRLKNVSANFGLFLTCFGLGVIVKRSQQVFLS